MVWCDYDVLDLMLANQTIILHDNQAQHPWHTARDAYSLELDTKISLPCVHAKGSLTI